MDTGSGPSESLCFLLSSRKRKKPVCEHKTSQSQRAWSSVTFSPDHNPPHFPPQPPLQLPLSVKDGLCNLIPFSKKYSTKPSRKWTKRPTGAVWPSFPVSVLALASVGDANDANWVPHRCTVRQKPDQKTNTTSWWSEEDLLTRSTGSSFSLLRHRIKSKEIKKKC